MAKMSGLPSRVQLENESPTMGTLGGGTGMRAGSPVQGLTPADKVKASTGVNSTGTRDSSSNTRGDAPTERFYIPTEAEVQRSQLSRARANAGDGEGFNGFAMGLNTALANQRAQADAKKFGVERGQWAERPRQKPKQYR